MPNGQESQEAALHLVSKIWQKNSELPFIYALLILQIYCSNARYKAMNQCLTISTIAYTLDNLFGDCWQCYLHAVSYKTYISKQYRVLCVSPCVACSKSLLYIFQSAIPTFNNMKILLKAWIKDYYICKNLEETTRASGRILQDMQSK